MGRFGIPNGEPKGLYLGSSEILFAYVGDDLLWDYRNSGGRATVFSVRQAAAAGLRIPKFQAHVRPPRHAATARIRGTVGVAGGAKTARLAATARVRGTVGVGAGAATARLAATTRVRGTVGVGVGARPSRLASTARLIVPQVAVVQNPLSPRMSITSLLRTPSVLTPIPPPRLTVRGTLKPPSVDPGLTPPVFDATAGSQGNGNRSWTHTVGSGGNKALFVVYTCINNGAGVPAPTVDGTAMTLVVATRTGGGQAISFVWAMYNVAPGAKAIVVNNGENYTTTASVSYSNAKSVVNVLSQGGSGTISAGPQTCTAGELHLAFVGARQGASFPNSTKRADVANSSGFSQAYVAELAGTTPASITVQGGGAVSITDLKLSSV